MIKHIWTILCRESVINQDDKSLSINKIFEGITVDLHKSTINENKLKINIPIHYEIVSYLIRDNNITSEESINLKVTLVDPETKIIDEKIEKITFNPKIKRMRSRIKVNGFPVSKKGNYKFNIAIKNKNEKEYRIVSEIPLEIILKR